MRVVGIQGSLFYSYTEYFHSERYFHFHGTSGTGPVAEFLMGVRVGPLTDEKFGTQYEQLHNLH